MLTVFITASIVSVLWETILSQKSIGLVQRGKKRVFLSLSFKRGHFRYSRKKTVINLGCFP